MTVCDTCGADQESCNVEWIDNETARCSDCSVLRTRIEAEVIQRVKEQVIEGLRDRAFRVFNDDFCDGWETGLTRAADALEDGTWEIK